MCYNSCSPNVLMCVRREQRQRLKCQAAENGMTMIGYLDYLMDSGSDEYHEPVEPGGVLEQILELLKSHKS